MMIVIHVHNEKLLHYLNIFTTVKYYTDPV